MDISQEQLAEMIGVSLRTIQNYESGGIIPKSKDAILRKLISTDFSKGEKPISEKANLIPFYDDVVTIGGTNNMVAKPESTRGPSEYIDTGDWFRDATAALRHYGDSMTEYPSGCILAIKEVKDKSLLVWGKDYVIETSEYRITKRVQKGKDEKYIRAYSTNKDTYPDGRQIHEPLDIPIDAARFLIVLGYVVKKNGGTMIYNNKK